MNSTLAVLSDQVPKLEDVLSAGDTSNWLKASIEQLLNRDPLDASKDAYMLHLLMQERLNLVLRSNDSG